MARQYTAVFSSVAVTAQQDFFEILAATGKRIKINAWALSQSTEVADAAEEELAVIVKRGVGATSGSGGSTFTPSPQDVDDTASGATVEINNTTKMSAGTITSLESYNWNVRAPFVMIYPPEMRPKIKPGDRLTIELATAPADSITMSGTVWFEED